MKSETFTLQGSDGTEFFVYKWSPDDQSKMEGAIQIAHGMAEHAARYEPFAEKATEAGFVVYANDHRGHGKTAVSEEDLGYFADENGWDLVADDQYELTKKIKSDNPQTPLFLLGHSMGSFIARTYVIKHSSEIAGLCLSGTTGDPGVMGFLGAIVAKIIASIYGNKTPSPLLDKLSFGAFNKAFKPTRTDFDWLSRDNEEVDKYIADPLCGFIATAGFFCDLMYGLGKINKKESVAAIRNDLPVFIFSGELDPVGNSDGSGPRKVAQAYKNAGIKDVTLKLYENGRHENFNELNRDEVFNDVINWIRARL